MTRALVLTLSTSLRTLASFRAEVPSASSGTLATTISLKNLSVLAVLRIHRN